MYRVILAAVLVCLPYSSFAAKPPKPVDELEARVEALEALIVDLEARPGPVQVLVNGESIGTFIDGARTLVELGGGRSRIIVLTDHNYIVSIESSREAPLADVIVVDPTESDGSSILFDQPGCMGNAYMREVWATSASRGQGLVVGLNDANNSIYYLPPFPVLRTDVLAQSELESGSSRCHDGLSSSPVFELIPNDPAITGVPNEPFTPPITLGQ